jgi:hypothetical protein
MHFGDIESVLFKRHFPGNRGPCEPLSPRYAAAQAQLDSVDIDAPLGKAKVVATSPGKDILPYASRGYSLACEVNEGAWRQAPRSHSFDYFDKTLQAKHYATLIGRPNAAADMPHKRMLLSSEVERHQRLHPISDDAADLSTVSTTASERSTSKKSACQAKKKSLAASSPFDDKSGKMPLGMRRMIASLGMDRKSIDSEMVKTLKEAFEAVTTTSAPTQHHNRSHKPRKTSDVKSNVREQMIVKSNVREQMIAGMVTPDSLYARCAGA